MNVEIYADIVCPWCYLGQARFRTALEQHDGEVTVAWRPFQLDPDAPVEAVSADEHLLEIFGSPAKVTAAHEQMRQLTGAEGLPYDPGHAHWVNTAKAHRVLWLAGQAGPQVQDALAARLFRAHHAEGRDVGDTETLVELAADAGLDGRSVRTLLAGSGGAAEVEQEIAQARAIGVTGVPFFVFEGQWAVSGAQSAEVLAGALQEVAKQRP